MWTKAYGWQGGGEIGLFRRNTIGEDETVRWKVAGGSPGWLAGNILR